jgi:hypothetical protein
VLAVAAITVHAVGFGLLAVLWVVMMPISRLPVVVAALRVIIPRIGRGGVGGSRLLRESMDWYEAGTGDDEEARCYEPRLSAAAGWTAD